jgi:hypothetical protein
VLLPQRPDSAGGEEKGGPDAVERRLENAHPTRGRPDWSPDRDVRKGISGPRLARVVLEVGHAGFGCTSHARPGMEIALPRVRDSHYTDPQ